eukprot:scaffold1296_cov129-Isochrysis_galbana.AAC.6
MGSTGCSGIRLKKQSRSTRLGNKDMISTTSMLSEQGGLWGHLDPAEQGGRWHVRPGGIGPPLPLSGRARLGFSG